MNWSDGDPQWRARCASRRDAPARSEVVLLHLDRSEGCQPARTRFHRTAFSFLCARPTGCFVAATSDRRLSLQGRYGELSIATHTGHLVSESDGFVAVARGGPSPESWRLAELACRAGVIQHAKSATLAQRAPPCRKALTAGRAVPDGYSGLSDFRWRFQPFIARSTGRYSYDRRTAFPTRGCWRASCRSRVSQKTNNISRTR
jgi:hypothetical protein